MSDAGRRAGLAALVRFATATSTSTLADNTVDTKSQSLSTIEKENATEVNKNQPEEGNTEVGEARHKQKADSNSNTNITVGKIVEMNSGTNCAIDLTESSDEDAKDSGVHLSDKVTANNHVGNSKRPGTPSIAVEYRKKDTKGSTKRSLAESPNNASMKKQRNCGSGSKPATNQASVYNNIEVAQPSAKTHELVWARKWTTPESCNANNFEAVDLKVLSYNVDKDAPHVADRMRAIADIIQHENLDAALLQELTIPSLDAMETALEKTSYRLLFDPKLVITYLKVQGGYFNAIVVNTATLKVREQSKCLYEFPGSCMGRHVLVVDVTTHTGGAARLMTSHLESLAEYSGERVKQLDWIFNHMAALNIPSIFGGDTNIRVKELKQTKVSVRGSKLAKKNSQMTVADAWTLAGSPVDAKYTWDLKLNDNIPTDPSRPYVPRFQFDKLFVSEGQNSSELVSSASNFHLVGTKRLPCRVFPSDHFGIVANIGIKWR